FSSRRRHTRFSRDWSSDVCSSDLSTSWIVARKMNALDRIGLHLLQSLFLYGHSAVVPLENLRQRPVTLWTCGHVFQGNPWHRARSEERRVGKEGRSRWPRER